MWTYSRDPHHSYENRDHIVLRDQHVSCHIVTAVIHQKDVSQSTMQLETLDSDQWHGGCRVRSAVNKANELRNNAD